MLIPRFTIRALLGLTTVVAVLCLIATYAVQGQFWAIAICAALGSLALVFLVYAGIFALAIPMALLDSELRSAKAPRSPFATHQLPPQILPPPEPE